MYHIFSFVGNCTCDVYINNNKLNPVIPYQRFQYNHQIVADNSQVHIPFKFNVTVEEYLRVGIEHIALKQAGVLYMGDPPADGNLSV